MTHARCSFGPFVLDPVCGQLQRNGKSVALGRRGLALLEALFDAEGRIVSKSDLMERGWPGSIVEEGNLTVQIAALRKALGQTPEGQEWIVTVPRVGYRLVRPGAAMKETEAPFPVLAVLPFSNLGGDPEQDYFADGVVDDVITALSRFRSFSVIARNSTFAYKGRNVDVRQVAKELGVRYVLEGSIRRAGNQLRITAQLIDGGSGAHLWAQNFDGALDDVFNFQDRITENVATVVEPHIKAAEIERSRRERPGSTVQNFGGIGRRERSGLCAAHRGAGLRAGQRTSAWPCGMDAGAPHYHGVAGNRRERPGKVFRICPARTGEGGW
jgi:TolB-like protein